MGSEGGFLAMRNTECFVIPDLGKRNGFLDKKGRDREAVGQRFFPLSYLKNTRSGEVKAR